MRLVYLPLLAFVIALTSLVTNAPTFEFSTDQYSNAQISNIWEADSLRLTEAKHTEKNNLIAQDFIPIVLIADQRDSSVDFFHYIPLHSLVREKEFFLLI